MAQRIKGIVRYDGTDFAGWQIQPGAQRTVQGVIESALSDIAGEPIRIHAAGRTDAGVHALAQIFHADWNGAKSLDGLRRSLSQMLAPDIRIESIEATSADFHARYAATSKRYGYVCTIDREADPFSARYAWRLPTPVDPDRVLELAQRFTGPHDFAGFCSSGSDVEDTVRTIYTIELHAGPLVGAFDTASHWRLEFHGSGFLYKMVRNLAGTLIDVARGAVPESRIDELLASSGPYRGFTAPAHGLFLMQVNYDEA